jgi:hypothetical protein
VIANDTQAYDLVRLIRDKPDAPYAEVFGEDPAGLRDASPLHHVAGGKGIPPFLILYSKGVSARGQNPMRPVYAKAFRDKLQSAGVAAEVVDASDRNHGQINSMFGDDRDRKVTGRAKKFLDGILAEAADRPARPRSSGDRQ